jgi:hypothetical protein
MRPNWDEEPLGLNAADLARSVKWLSDLAPAAPLTIQINASKWLSTFQKE